MKTLAKDACSAWLRDRAIAEAPYSLARCPTAFVDQVRLPDQPWQKRAIAEQLLSACKPYEAALLQFTDWVPLDDAMVILGGMRAQYGDQRPLIDTPGHLIDRSEHQLLLGMFVVAMSYGFTTYVYFSHGTTILGWEGEMLDVWTGDSRLYFEAQRVFNANNLVHHRADA